jgi:hypothetical protein
MARTWQAPLAPGLPTADSAFCISQSALPMPVASLAQTSYNNFRFSSSSFAPWRKLA